MRFAGRRQRNHPTTLLRQGRFWAKQIKARDAQKAKKTRVPKRRKTKQPLITNYAPGLSRNTDAYVDEIKRRQPSAFGTSTAVKNSVYRHLPRNSKRDDRILAWFLVFVAAGLAPLFAPLAALVLIAAIALYCE